MPFDNTPGEGSVPGPGYNPFWLHVISVREYTFTNLLPGVLNSLYRAPTVGSVGFRCPHYNQLVLYNFGENDAEYKAQVVNAQFIAGPNPSFARASVALMSIPYGALISTRAKNVPLVIIAATDEETRPIITAGILSMGHLFGDTLDSLISASASNPYCDIMLKYFQTIDVATIVIKPSGRSG